MSVPSDFKVAQLREALKGLGLSTNGTKSELLIRLAAGDPENTWMRDALILDDRAEDDEQAREIGDGDVQGFGKEKELELIRKEKELVQRELEIARRELEILRLESASRQGNEGVGQRIVEGGNVATFNVKSVAELLSNFEGSSESFENWERQVRLIRDTYGIEDKSLRLLISSRLKGKAVNWFHSKPEHITMSTENLLNELRSMFAQRPSRLLLRKKFEERLWKRHESFTEYLHDKIILANQIPVEENEMLEYVIDGIPDPGLRDQARIQGFATRRDLLTAFEKVTLRQKTSSNLPIFNKSKDEGKLNNMNDNLLNKCCFTCGKTGHLSRRCPTKEKVTRCFACGDLGHIALKCTKKAKEQQAEINAVNYVPREKYVKIVNIENRKITALVDTGSDLSLMRQELFTKFNTMELIKSNVLFRGVGSRTHATLGVCTTDVNIDDNKFVIDFHVVDNRLISYDVLIGLNFLKTVDFYSRDGNISIVSRNDDCLSPEVAEIFAIDDVSVNEINLSHVNDDIIKDY